MSSADLLAAFALGLFSAPHCATMCGSVAGALLLAARPQQLIASTGNHSVRQPGINAMPAVADAAIYGSAKILGYMALGALLGAGGYLMGGTHRNALAMLNGAAALLLVLLGLYVAGWWRGISRLEQYAYRIWQPLMRKLQGLSLTRTRNKWLAGFAWGLLPCGMVYSALGLAVASGSVLQGMALMLAFGLGTLPFVLLSGSVMQTLLPLLRQGWLRQSCGMAMMVLGLLKLSTLG